jgi:copper(I)-binding protein
MSVLLNSFLSRVAAGAAVLALIGSAAQARDYDIGALHIGHPWVRATPPGAPTAAGYLTITNHGAHADRLMGGVSPDVGDIQIHEMTMTGQIMRMRPIIGGLEIAPGQTVTLAPEGDRHLMLIGPKHPLKPGDGVDATLRFERAGPVRVIFAVQAAAGPSTRPMHMVDKH